MEEGSSSGGAPPPPRNGEHVALDLIELFLGITKHFLHPDGGKGGGKGDNGHGGKMDCTCLGNSIFICAKHDAGLADRSSSGAANVAGCLPGARCLPAGKAGGGGGDGDGDAAGHAQVAMAIKKYFCKLASAFFPEAVIWCQLFVTGKGQ